jgi:acyl-CoA thioesterase-1
MRKKTAPILLLGICLLLLEACTGGSDSGQPADRHPSPADTAAAAEKTAARKNILFFGNSLTAAYGLDPALGYVALLQRRLDSLGLPYRAVNAGLSGETTAGGRERLDWVLQQPLDIFVLELGGNDALRGLDPTATYDNLSAIIQQVRAKYPAAKVVLAGMEAPPNMGPDYTAAFRKVYPRLARELNASLIPFFLEGVGGVPELNQEDRIHPNEKGQYLLLENVWEVLEPLL